ncbi:helix-turn-helix domain-containing protein [Micromonospora sp. RP3T]|uniref:helix-turn-helix domain-containing protein n=1 Tax=Micromonospora sp. RP3T TaxID=2135446 RepID=UPI000D15AB24|nr:AraC family transcriptional regulator [Micromonospora sp. RP3T]PTA47772.1 AraC family transcriptional regulator [Micromonospora sp. RP3T]
MDDAIEKAVQRAIAAMHEKLGEQLTVDDMARAAMFSKFHFTRVFQQATGVTPGRFLSALRLQRAKRLLVSTSLKVADISMRVGYNSVGTFSSRFTRSVGMPPTTYRRLAGFATQIATDPDYRMGHPHNARVHGRAWAPESHADSPVFLALFPDRIPEGQPVRCTVLPRPGPYQLDYVPPGNWFVLAQSITGEPDADVDADDGDRTVCVATSGPLQIRGDGVVHADVDLQPARAMDPPVLLALLDQRKLALARMADERVGVSSIGAAAAGRSAA